MSRDRSGAAGADPPVTLSGLLGMSVLGPGGEPLGHVQDIRLARAATSTAPWGPTRVATLIIDGRHAGSLLGYDRRAEQGPALLRMVIGWLHRRARIVAWEDVELARGSQGAVLRLRAGRHGQDLRPHRRPPGG